MYEWEWNGKSAWIAQLYLFISISRWDAKRALNNYGVSGVCMEYECVNSNRTEQLGGFLWKVFTLHTRLLHSLMWFMLSHFVSFFPFLFSKWEQHLLWLQLTYMALIMTGRQSVKGYLPTFYCLRNHKKGNHKRHCTQLLAKVNPLPIMQIVERC